MRQLSFYALSALGFACGTLCCGADMPADLGNVMFVGDSITHGFGAPSYRWPLHKILVDNGVQYVAVGVTEGNQNPRFCVLPGTPYAGVPFSNRHSAMSSERAYEIAGRVNQSGRLGNSNIADWLGLDATYEGDYRLNMPSQTPNLVVMMIGTNDTFGDFGNKGGIGKPGNMQEAQKQLLGQKDDDGQWNGRGDLDVIVDSLRAVNPQVRVLMLTIPTWHDARHNNNSAADYAALKAYNESLAQWASFKQVELADVNELLVNPARQDKPGVAEEQFFHSRDRLHPTVQGDLLIAAKVAEALDIPGRTVGLPRRAAAEFTSLSIPEGELKRTVAMPLPESEAETFTAVVQCSVGNGAVDGWSSEGGLRFSIGNGQDTGVLLISESAVLWGTKAEQVLYRADMSVNTKELRVAYVAGNSELGYTPGFYVWLGDQLIGEALEGMSPAANGHVPGLILSAKKGAPVYIKSAAVGAGAFAPAVSNP